MHKLTIKGDYPDGEFEVLLDGNPITICGLDFGIHWDKDPVVRLEIYAQVELEDFPIHPFMVLESRNPVTGEVLDEDPPLPFPQED